MQLLICNCYGCDNELLTISEVKNRVCEGHRKRAALEENYVGVCWSCGYITAVGNRNWDRKEKEYKIKAKYIMSKGCAECTGDSKNNINWMTIPGDTVERIISDVAVTEITDQTNRLFADYQPAQA